MGCKTMAYSFINSISTSRKAEIVRSIINHLICLCVLEELLGYIAKKIPHG